MKEEAASCNEPPCKNDFVDNLTLELMINKNHYKKYMLTKHPEKSREQEGFMRNCHLYEDAILAMTSELLDEPNYSKYSYEMIQQFQQYAKMCISCIKQNREREEEQNMKYTKNDEDVLFPDDV
jgi:hypothetical protein